MSHMRWFVQAIATYHHLPYTIYHPSICPRRGYRQPRLADLQRIYHSLCDRPRRTTSKKTLGYGDIMTVGGEGDLWKRMRRCE
jgi:hypothetical protein